MCNTLCLMSKKDRFMLEPQVNKIIVAWFNAESCDNNHCLYKDHKVNCQRKTI